MGETADQIFVILQRWLVSHAPASLRLPLSALLSVVAIVGAFALGLSFVLPESSSLSTGPVDWRGMVSFTGALVALISALIEGPQAGWGSPLNIAAYAMCAGLLAAFAFAELKGRFPMFDLRLLRQPVYASLCAAVVALVLGFTPLLVYLPGTLHNVRSPAGCVVLIIWEKPVVFEAN